MGTNPEFYGMTDEEIALATMGLAYKDTNSRYSLAGLFKEVYKDQLTGFLYQPLILGLDHGLSFDEPKKKKRKKRKAKK